eukprot:128577-Prymnesium_polylepis.1
MADSIPLERLSVAQLASEIGAIGSVYAPYAKLFEESGVSGLDVVEDYIDTCKLADLFEGLGIKNLVHCNVLRKRLLEWRQSNIDPSSTDDSKMISDVPSMTMTRSLVQVFGDTSVYRDGLSGRLGALTRSVLQEFTENEDGQWLPQLDYVRGVAKQEYPSTKGKAKTDELKDSYTRDLGHDGWTVQRFWEAQPDKLRGARSWAERDAPGGLPTELRE